jgi:hypothetical protein
MAMQQSREPFFKEFPKVDLGMAATQVGIPGS